MKPAPVKLYLLRDPEKFCVVEVEFSDGGRGYRYVAQAGDYRTGQLVVVPTTWGDFGVATARVVGVRPLDVEDFDAEFDYRFVVCGLSAPSSPHESRAADEWSRYRARRLGDLRARFYDGADPGGPDDGPLRVELNGAYVRDPATVLDRLRRELGRALADRTQVEVAASAGVSQTTVSKVLKGNVVRLRRDLLEKLAPVVGLEVVYPNASDAPDTPGVAVLVDGGIASE